LQPQRLAASRTKALSYTSLLATKMDSNVWQET
jgi:hypothetical protein